MSIKLMASAWELDIPSTEKLVLLCLCDYANDSGSNCWPSIGTIARKCSKGDRTIQGAIKWLSENGYLHLETAPGKVNQYALDPRKICTPAEIAPPQKTTRPPQKLRDTPAEVADEPLNNHQEPPKQVSAKVSRPDGVGAELWRDFLKVRQAKRAPLTETALSAIRREAEKAGWPLPAAIEECVSRGWQAFKADWVAKAPENRKAAEESFTGMC